MRARAAAALAGGIAAVLLAILGGCATLPNINPDMAWPSSKTVRIEDGHGPLTAAQSKAVLDRLKARGGETSIFDRHLTLEESIAGSPPACRST